jgi:gamma-glutamyltranspeptidase/glutathione hydrolase
LSAAGDPSLDDEARALQVAYGASGAGPLTGTTHISVVDANGTAAALSSTLGSGSGVFRGGAQLNNMLGELDVIGRDPWAPGVRLPTMLAPTLVLEDGRPRLVLGSAGSVRLAGAIAQVAWRVIGASSESVSEAIDAPRIHVDGSTLHLEGGWAEDATLRLGDGFEVVRWLGRNLFFGGVQAVELRSDGTLAAAGDPRRGGAGRVVE